MKRKILVLAAFLLFASLVYIRCGNEANNDESISLKGQADLIDGQPIITLENGQKLIGQQEISNEFAKIMSDPSARVQIEVANEIYQTDTSSGVYTSPVVVALPAGYSFVVHWDQHYIGSCIKRDVKHINVVIGKKGVNGGIANLHIAAWTQSGRPCVGIYLTSMKNAVFCWSRCAPTYGDIVGGIASALIAAGIASTAAWALAYIIAPIITGALAL